MSNNPAPGAPSNNMQIWKQVERSDPEFTKPVGFGGGFKFTAIDAQSQIKRATELFGPVGSGWGTRNERFEMLVVDPNDPHYNLLTYQAQFWYVHGGKECTFEIAADIELFEKTKNDWRRQSDAYKKVRTDSVTKALSWLGFNADIFMGKFDDSKYVKQLQDDKQAALQGLATSAQKEDLTALVKQAGWHQEQVKIWLKEKGWTWQNLTPEQVQAFTNTLMVAIQQKAV